jgi:hypothetical protein
MPKEEQEYEKGKDECIFVYFYLEMGMKCQGLLLLKMKTKFP